MTECKHLIINYKLSKKHIFLKILQIAMPLKKIEK